MLGIGSMLSLMAAETAIKFYCYHNDMHVYVNSFAICCERERGGGGEKNGILNNCPNGFAIKVSFSAT